MDENYLQNDEVVRLSRVWLRQMYPLLNEKLFVDVHISSLLSIDTTKLSKTETVELALLVFQSVISEAKLLRIENTLTILLVLPLKTRTNILTRNYPHSFKKMLRDLSHEPPSVYLMKPRHEAAVEWEEYRSPLPFKFPDDDSEIVTTYRESRSADAIRNNWEYSRAIFLELMPYPA